MAADLRGYLLALPRLLDLIFLNHFQSHRNDYAHHTGALTP